MPSLLHREWVERFSDETKAGSWLEPRMGLSTAKASTPTVASCQARGAFQNVEAPRTNMIIMTVALDHDVR